MSYYLIVSKYVGPNDRDSHGNILGDTESCEICTQPGRTNMSNEPRTIGWLGTSNDNSRTAYGEFDTLDEARAAAADLGYTELSDSDADSYEDGSVEIRVSAEADRTQWSADDWLLNGLGKAGTIAQYGITALTTDAELKKAADRVYAEAVDNDVELHGALKLFTELRDELRDATFDTVTDALEELDSVVEYENEPGPGQSLVIITRYSGTVDTAIAAITAALPAYSARQLGDEIHVSPILA